ncbi:MAG: hypothetical protein M0Q91_06485 [Methanoregula sp.]|jgi:hypothetical protein|nr:hypothetical protein [Methanoregula sp.]
MDNNVKLSKIWSFLLALFLIAIVIIPIAGAGTEETKRVFPENDTAGYLPVDVISIDPSIKDSTPYYQFLIMSSEGKENQLNDLDLAIDFLYPGDPQKDVLKAELRGKMKDIWDEYPVVFETKPGVPGYPTYGGAIVTVKFASPLQNIRLTAEENDVIKKSSSITNEAYTRKKQNESPYAPNSSPDSPGVRPTAPQPASIPALITIYALCCCSAGYAVTSIRSLTN